MLYPLEFTPTFHYRIWAGNSMKTVLNKDISEEKIGESWEISTVPEFVSVVKNGALQNNDLNSLIQKYKSDLVGNAVWERFGTQFPLLIKFIDAAEPLSVQVHPDDSYALKHHQSFGKTEMWYIMEADEEAELILGFQPNVTQQVYEKHLENQNLEQILRNVRVEKNDVLYIPAKRVHAIGKGIILAEIQQTSDVTYRMYDFNRIDKDGKPRELHSKQAIEVADFSFIEQPKIDYSTVDNEEIPLVDSKFFKTQKWNINQDVPISINPNSFMILIGIEGTFSFTVHNSTEKYSLSKGNVMLIPANSVSIHAQTDVSATFLTVHL